MNNLDPTRLFRGLAVTLAALAAGCAASPPVTDGADYRQRAPSKTSGDVRVSVSALSPEESLAVYDFPLAEKGIQPVWIQVENREDRGYFLLFPGVDPGFFPPSEAAEAFASFEEQPAVERGFRSLAFTNPIPPGRTVSGFVLTSLDEGVKAIQVDLWSSGQVKDFSFVVPVPGFAADYVARGVFDQQRYEPEEIVHYEDPDAFRTALEELPCCVTNKDGDRDGDPLNLVVIGGLNDAFPAMVRRGWRPTEQTWSGSVMRMIQSALANERYPYAPVSSLYLFGRPQDLALQRARDNIHQRNHLRLWLSPMRFRDRPVWVGQISRDIGSRLTIHSPTLTTHKIDPDVDEARTALVEDMAYSQNLAAFGLVSGVGEAPRHAPRENLTTDPYFTDGLRAVLVFDEKPHSLAEIDFLPWQVRKIGGLLPAQGASE
ncbi:MAG: LssY C-terminal domain-containing protein [Gammaproteobacteria bacterium]